MTSLCLADPVAYARVDGEGRAWLVTASQGRRELDLTRLGDLAALARTPLPDSARLLCEVAGFWIEQARAGTFLPAARRQVSPTASQVAWAWVPSAGDVTAWAHLSRRCQREQLVTGSAAVQGGPLGGGAAWTAATASAPLDRFAWRLVEILLPAPGPVAELLGVADLTPRRFGLRMNAVAQRCLLGKRLALVVEDGPDGAALVARATTPRPPSALGRLRSGSDLAPLEDLRARHASAAHAWAAAEEAALRDVWRGCPLPAGLDAAVPVGDPELAVLLRRGPALLGAGFPLVLPEALELPTPAYPTWRFEGRGAGLRVRAQLVLGCHVDDVDQLRRTAPGLLRTPRGAVRTEDVTRRPLPHLVGTTTALPARQALAGLLRLRPEVLAGAQHRPVTRVDPMTDQPTGFAGTLLPHQLSGVAWLAALEQDRGVAVLADEMGLGKTAQAIGLILTRPVHTVVVAPMALRENWVRELARFAPGLPVHVDVRTPQPSHGSAAGPAVTVLSYEAVARLPEAVLARWRANAGEGNLRLIVDEAHRLPRPASAAGRALAVLVRAGATWVAMSGNPPTARLLRRMLAIPSPRLLPAAGGRPETVEAVCSALVLRRTKAALAGLVPQAHRVKHGCPLPGDAAAQVRAAVAGLTETLADLPALARHVKVREHLAWQARLPYSGTVSRDSKLAVCEQLVRQELAEGGSVLLFTDDPTTATHVHAVLTATLAPPETGGPDLPVRLLTPAMTRQERTRVTDDFTFGKTPSVLVATYAAAALGLNLTRAARVLLLDLPGDVALVEQAIARLWRLGQDRQVVADFLLTPLEEALLDRAADAAAEPLHRLAPRTLSSLLLTSVRQAQHA